MDDNQNFVHRLFLRRIGVKTVLTLTIFAAAATIAIALLLLPGTAGTSTVSAQDLVSRDTLTGERATPEMISYALNMRSAARFTVFADRGVTDTGSSIRGEVADALRDNAGIQARRELSSSMDAIRQLPCLDLKTPDLAGKRIGPGVYCLPSAELNGDLILDAQGDASAAFVFRVAGAANFRNGSTISLENRASAGNVYFASNDAVTVGNDANIRANLLAKGDINVGAGTTIGGRTMSLGKVSLNQDNLGGGTGTLQICKEQTGTTDISNRIFNFTVTGVDGVIAVPVGSCSAPLDVPVGPAIVTELNDGQLITGGGFSGNFQLVGVDVITTNSPSTLGVVNLSLRTAAVTIAEGGTAQQITLRFTNQFAITGFVEICKTAANVAITTTPPPEGGNGGVGGVDPDVTGFFTFTVEGVFTTNTQNPTVRVLQQFVAPVGQCTGPIAVTIRNPVPTGEPLESTVRVSELPRAGFFLESASTIPPDRQVSAVVLGSIVNANGTVVAANGGGYITVRVLEGATSANETLITFVNRTNPGLVKVCKIAAPGVPINTLFRFVVRGIGALDASVPQAAAYGAVERTVDVRAGTPESGGTCAFVPGFGGGVGRSEFQTFIIGSPVLVYETGISPLNTVPQPTGQIRVSRIRSTSGFFPGIFSPNPDIDPGTAPGPLDFVGRAAVPARAEVVEVEFVNFYFNPAFLKVCKIGAGGLTGAFTFDVNLVSPTGVGGPLFPDATVAVTVNAGPVTQGGFCTLVDGTGFLGGAFNAGSTVDIVERESAGSSVTTIVCPTCGPGGLTTNIGTRTGTLIGPNGLIAANTINTVTFTNATAASPVRSTLFDFDGDGRADPSVFRASNATWWYAASGTAGSHRAVTFGIPTDRIVPADYDGDRKTDVAIYRGGQWHVLGSTAGYFVVTFGLPDDIPQTGDFDGDGKADFTVYRPSTGTWYMLKTRDGFTAFPFGLPSDKPVAADYDGDGRTDAAVYRNGTWYLLRSRDGFGAIQFGLAGDRPVAADYDGDGRADVAVFRGGIWHILRSTSGYFPFQFGLATDLPVAADYDGDGRTDIAVFRPTDGVWHIMRSGQAEATGYTSFQFGFGTDTPVPSN
jgi:hypothetical protein